MKQMNKDSLTAQGKKLLEAIEKYRVFIFVIAFLGIYAFLIIQISSFVQSEPSPAEVSKESTIGSLKIDQDSINKILELEDQNIEVKALFEQARNNPFSE